MHEIRSFLTGGEPRKMLASKKTSGLDQSRGSGLTAIAIPRVESRKVNQRREDRFVNLVEQAELVFRRKRFEVSLSNVSASGVMIEADIEPRIGEQVEISFEGCNRTRPTVRWIKDGRIGLEFARETVLIARPADRKLVASGRRAGEQPPRPDAKPRAPRRRMIWKGVLKVGGISLDVRLHNISSSGAMLDCGEDVLVGMPVVLELAGVASMPVAGRVRWCRAGHAGIRFDAPFDMKSLAVVRPDAEAS